MKGNGTVLVEVRADVERRLHTEPREQIACNKRRGETRLEGNAPGGDTDGPSNQRNGFRSRERGLSPHFNGSPSFHQPFPWKNDKRDPSHDRRGDRAPKKHSLERRKLTPPLQKPSHAIRRNSR